MNTTDQLAKSSWLLQRRRFREAEQLLRQELANDPRRARAHALLALALTAQNKTKEAIAEAQQGAGYGPGDDYCHYVLAMILFHADRDKEALAALHQALRIDARDPDYYNLLGKIHLSMGDWNRALEDARVGLSYDPQNVDCLNLESMALTRLGRAGEAEAAVQSALRLDPESKMAHANMGWARLHAGKHADALVHFKEALRLDPQLEYARNGIVEAMKARSIIYKPVLSYFLWMDRLPPNARWGVVVGMGALSRVLRNVLRLNPGLVPIIGPLIGLVVLFFFFTWVAIPLFNLLLRLDPLGRLALSKEEIAASNWVGLCLFGGLGLAAAGLLAGAVPLSLSGLGLVALSLPAAGIFRAKSGKGRAILTAYTIALAVIGLLAGGLGLANSEAGLGLGLVFIIGWMLYTWVGNFVINMRPA